MNNREPPNRNHMAESVTLTSAAQELVYQGQIRKKGNGTWQDGTYTLTSTVQIKGLQKDVTEFIIVNETVAAKSGPSHSSGMVKLRGVVLQDKRIK